MLKITTIREKGDLSKERIVMKAQNSGNVGEFMLVQTGLQEGSVTNKVYEAFWFPDKDVKAGDFVVVYTKRGSDSAKPFNGVTSHFFYWGKDQSIWSSSEKAAVLMHAPEWESLKPEQV